MDVITLIFLAIALALDAFSVAIVYGLTLKIDAQQSLIIALFFGGFQAIMPIIGWILGGQLQTFISTIAPWVAFILLIVIGIKMIYDSFSYENVEMHAFSLKALFGLSIATSIDAFAIGVTLALLNTPIIQPIIIIGLITFIMSLIGVYLGKKVGSVFENKIEILGGLILIGIGFIILLEHLLP